MATVRDLSGNTSFLDEHIPTPGGGGGSGGGDASAANQVITNTKLDTLIASIGSISDTEWDGEAVTASVISILKFDAQRTDAMATDILTNTSPATVAQDSSVIRIGDTDYTPKFASFSSSSTSNFEIVAAVTGKKIRVVAYAITQAAEVNTKFRSASTDKTGPMYQGAAGAPNPWGHFETAVGEALNGINSAGVAVGGYVVYIEV